MRHQFVCQDVISSPNPTQKFVCQGAIFTIKSLIATLTSCDANVGNIRPPQIDWCLVNQSISMVEQEMKSSHMKVLEHFRTLEKWSTSHWGSVVGQEASGFCRIHNPSSNWFTGWNKRIRMKECNRVSYFLLLREKPPGTSAHSAISIPQYTCS